MVRLAFSRLVNPRVWIQAGAPKIPNVPKQVPVSVLHSQAAKVNSNPKKRNCRFALGPTLNRQGLNQHEATAAEHFVQEMMKAGAQCRKRKVITADRC